VVCWLVLGILDFAFSEQTVRLRPLQIQYRRVSLQRSRLVDAQ
jgi:hypothetical protein